MIERSTVPHVRGSTASGPLPCSDAGVLTSSATVNGVVPSGGPDSYQDQLVILGCRECQMVAVVAWAGPARVPLVGKVP
jgi:hypothetical protein